MHRMVRSSLKCMIRWVEGQSALALLRGGFRRLELTPKYNMKDATVMLLGKHIENQVVTKWVKLYRSDLGKTFPF